MGYKDVINRFSTTWLGSRIARQYAARIDPVLYRLTGGRITSTGLPTIPQVLLTTTGRKTGKQRTVQLGYIKDGADYILVASNFGGKKHPAWSFNLMAIADALVQEGFRRVPVKAELLSDDDKAKVWPRLCEAVPQYRTYVTWTDRNIRVFRLRPSR